MQFNEKTKTILISIAWISVLAFVVFAFTMLWMASFWMSKPHYLTYIIWVYWIGALVFFFTGRGFPMFLALICSYSYLYVRKFILDASAWGFRAEDIYGPAIILSLTVLSWWLRSKTKLDIFTIFKTKKLIFIFCCLGLPFSSPTPSVAEEIIPSEAHETVLFVHNYYFRLREMGKYKAAYSMFTERQKENNSLEEFSRFWRKAHKRFGKLTHLNNLKVTWYKNPEGAPEGRYAAIDYRARFERLPIFCGYLLWSIDEGYKIQREEMGFLENKSGKPMSDAEKEKAYKALSCR